MTTPCGARTLRVLRRDSPRRRADIDKSVDAAPKSACATRRLQPRVIPCRLYGMKSRIVRTRSEEETVALGETLAAELPAKVVVLLIGNLGAGKTTLAKGIVQGLGAAQADEVSSPTFTLIHEYGPRVYHVDLYRLDRAEQVATIGLDELFERAAVVLVEWGERFPELMPEERVEITLRAVGEDEREIVIRR